MMIEVMKQILLFVVIVPAIDGFLPLWSCDRLAVVSSKTKTAIEAYPECFDRAVECGSDFDRCDVEELLTLADDLERFKGAYFEESPTLQIKEVKDREDLADVLRLEAELKLRQDYLRNANIFCDDVKKVGASKEKKDYMEIMDEYADY